MRIARSTAPAVALCIPIAALPVERYGAFTPRFTSSGLGMASARELRRRVESRDQKKYIEAKEEKSK